MTFWLMELPAGATIRDYIAMPEYNGTDWTACHTPSAVKKRLAAADEFLPPESLELQAMLIWRFLRKLEEEDIVTASTSDGLSFAQVSGNAYFAEGENRVPVSWFDIKPNMLPFRRFTIDLQRAPSWPQEIQNKALKQAIRNQLPLPGNRFRKWYWIIIVVLAIKFFVLAVHFSERSGW